MNSTGRLMEVENGSHALYHCLLTASTQPWFFLNAPTLEADFLKTHLPSSLSLIVFLAGPHQQQWKLAESRQQRADEDCFKEELFSPNGNFLAENIPAVSHSPAFWKCIYNFSKEILLKHTAMRFTAAPASNVWVCANKKIKKKNKKEKTITNQNYFLKGRENVCHDHSFTWNWNQRFFCMQGHIPWPGQSAVAKL